WSYFTRVFEFQVERRYCRALRLQRTADRLGVGRLSDGETKQLPGKWSPAEPDASLLHWPLCSGHLEDDAETDGELWTSLGAILAGSHGRPAYLQLRLWSIQARNQELHLQERSSRSLLSRRPRFSRQLRSEERLQTVSAAARARLGC